MSEPAKAAATKMAEFRLIPRIETYPKIVSFAQTPLGKVILIGVFGQGLFFYKTDLLAVPPFLLLLGFITFLPRYRRLSLALSPILIFLGKSFHSPLEVASMFSVLLTGVLLYLCARRWPQSRFGQRPVVFLLTGLTLLILCACAVTGDSLPHAILWSLTGAAVTYVWYIGFALLDRSSTPSNDLTLELVRFRPIGVPDAAPIPKGAAYLRRIEAKNPEQLAVAQLKGLKLLAWAILLSLFFKYWNSFFHGYLMIQTLDDALAMSVKGTSLAWQTRWEGLILSFFESILAMAIFTHKVVACCRMAGYNALRGTYRPLSSRTIAEFFNRYAYYYKELLVDFFFYPAFLRYWKGHRRLRMVFATFAAACLGNAFFHFIEDWTIIRDKGLWSAMIGFQAFFFYCIILATALSISQLRKRGAKPVGFVRGRVLPAFGVGLFYCFLNVLSCDRGSYPLVEHLKYLAGLFSIHF
jgi:hypothetical protein